jgi:hypothetical protein
MMRAKSGESKLIDLMSKIELKAGQEILVIRDSEPVIGTFQTVEKHAPLHRSMPGLFKQQKQWIVLNPAFVLTTTAGVYSIRNLGYEEIAETDIGEVYTNRKKFRLILRARLPDYEVLLDLLSYKAKVK